EGIVRLLGEAIRHPDDAGDVPRAEVYLVRSDARQMHGRAVASGAREIGPPELRDWGQVVSYALDPDGHVLAFASEPESPEGA
ncbi:MAG TPA: hypothetical protein PLV92_29705, partial [Pirellulaceae bacterium]|nr:hypothetical protein [Pirellulaceae bacterium]